VAQHRQNNIPKTSKTDGDERTRPSRFDELCNSLRDDLLDAGATLDDMLRDLRVLRKADGRVDIESATVDCN